MLQFPFKTGDCAVTGCLVAVTVCRAVGAGRLTAAGGCLLSPGLGSHPPLDMAHYHRMFLRCLLFVHIASAFLSAAVPAPDPWRLGCPATAPSPPVDLDPCGTSSRQCRCTGTQLIAASPQGRPGPRRGTRRGQGRGQVAPAGE